ncbi:MAG: hypothetical protein HY303_10875 [Candidatus Wallbacteria bacterium]|nr:hypothetical protein [Candidatus Wallbacteria bacterium]
MADWMEMHFGLTTDRFCDLLQETIEKLREVLRNPDAHDKIRVDMARGAMRILVKGPHFVPRERKMAYVDDLLHLLVAREALFPGDVKRGLFESICVGMPDPPRKALMDLTTHISEGSPDVSDQELLQLSQEESEKIGWRHPRRLVIYHRVVGLLSLTAIFAIVWFGNRYMADHKMLEPKWMHFCTGLAFFWVLAANTLLHIVFLRPPPSEFGPELVDLASENASQVLFMANATSMHVTEIYVTQPLLGVGAAAASWYFACWILWYGQKAAEWVVSVLSHYGWLFWKWIH